MKWEKDEELQFVKGVANGKTFDELAIIHNRTSSALELRLKKIIYDNVSKGRGVSKLAKGLNLDKNKVIQYYYSYAEFREKNGKDVVHADIDNKSNNNSDNKLDKKHDNKSDNKSDKKHDNKSDNKSVHREINHKVLKKSTEHKVHKIESKMNILEKQNKLLEIVIKNNRMRKYINQLNKDGRLDSATKKIIKRIVR
jgi:hypothetical protein